MNETPLISVIVPVYRVEKYLDRCLQSIAGQTYRNLEMMAVLTAAVPSVMPGRPKTAASG